LKRALTLITITLVLATAGSLIGPVTAPAAPIDDKQAQAAELERQITENGRRIDALNEQVNSAQLALVAASDTIALADAQVAAARAKTRDLRRQLAERAAAVYRHAGSRGVANLDAGSALELSTRETYTALAAQREKQLVAQLANAREDLALRKADAEKARGAAQASKDQVESALADRVAGDNKQRELLSQVKGEIAELVAQQERARRAREETEARARMAAAAPAVQSGGRSSGGGVTIDPKDIPAPSPRAAQAIAYAYAQLGKPYCYAGAGPACFDCSGLTMMAWGSAGVGMPHGSTEQYNMFPHVPLSQAQPGDLVVWDGHVGLYIGGGTMIHAPHSGTVVQVAPVYGTPWGAARPS
jgi:cell wall-associated NlpC family hydrolase